MEFIFEKHAGPGSDVEPPGDAPSAQHAMGNDSDTEMGSPDDGTGDSDEEEGSTEEEDEPEWPGLSFGMDSDEGKALLGTPNGIGTARLLIDRAAQLGRRELKVYMFARHDGKYCMLWDMAPPGHVSSPGHGGKKRRVQRWGRRYGRKVGGSESI